MLRPRNLQDLLRAFCAAALCAFLLLAARTPAAAQDSAGSNATFWLQEDQRAGRHARPSGRHQTQVRRLVPNKRLARPTNWRAPLDPPHQTQPVDAHAPVEPLIPTEPPQGAQPQVAQPPAGPADPRTADVAPPPAEPAAPAAPVGAAQQILVVGDNVGWLLGQGLNDAALESNGRFVVTRKARDSTGLVRDDYYDWRKTLADLLAGPEKYAAVAIMIGSNDRQELRDAAGRYEPLSPRWRELYAERVKALLAPAKERGVPVFWIGLPIMRAERYAAEIAQINEIQRKEAEAMGGRYVDVWDAFADENGHFSVFGPDVNGQVVKLRTSDGIHFTKAGARKLAYFTEQAMRSVLERQPPRPAAPEPPLAALPPAPADAPQPATPAAAAPAIPAAPAPPPKPVAGPILPLTTPPLSAGGELAGPAPKGAADLRASAAAALAEGRALVPPPGRADDFSWPRK